MTAKSHRKTNKKSVSKERSRPSREETMELFDLLAKGLITHEQGQAVPAQTRRLKRALKLYVKGTLGGPINSLTRVRRKR